MLLVPAEFAETLGRKESLFMPPVTKIQLNLDKEMEQILQSNLPPYSKAQLYNSTLQKFINMQRLNETNTEPPTAIQP